MRDIIEYGVDGPIFPAERGPRRPRRVPARAPWASMSTAPRTGERVLLWTRPADGTDPVRAIGAWCATGSCWRIDVAGTPGPTCDPLAWASLEDEPLGQDAFEGSNGTGHGFPSVLVREDTDGGLDEVVSFGAFVHLEYMDDDAVWIGVEGPDGTLAHVRLVSDAPIRGRVEDETWGGLGEGVVSVRAGRDGTCRPTGGVPAGAAHRIRDFQRRMRRAFLDTFHDRPGALDAPERADRVAEEVAELLQSVGMSEDRLVAHVRRTYARPRGDAFDEAGGVLTTLSGLFDALGIDMEHAAVAGLATFVRKRERIRAKDGAKRPGDLVGPDPSNALVAVNRA